MHPDPRHPAWGDPPLLDLYCGAGVGADGYIAAGFTPTGVDAHPQPSYPGRFVQADALGYLARDVNGPALIHASPPCQLFTRAKHLRDAQGYDSKETLDYLTPTLALLRRLHPDIPWVVENVPGAHRLMEPQEGEHLTRLCGSSFGLGVQRHRYFLTNFPVPELECDHSRFPVDEDRGKPRPWGVYHRPNDDIPSGGRTVRSVEHGHEVMGMTRRVSWDELKEGFPPAYAEHIGRAAHASRS